MIYPKALVNGFPTHDQGGIKMIAKRALVTVLFIFLASILTALAAPQANTEKSVAIQAKNPIVSIETTMGIIKVELFPGKAPITVKNFLDYVESGFYIGTIVHRVDFVIGCGGYTEALSGKPTRPGIKNESKNGLKNLRGTLSMARYDNPDSATSQFFINLNDNSHLDASGAAFGYAVFGKVIEGMDVVDKIAAVKTGTKGGFQNIPLQTIMIRVIKVVS
jgi:cyclophilin family peptidyl-prolyl cis-trans isomerase